MDFGADADDTFLIQMPQSLFGYVGNVGGNYFRPQPGLADLNHEINDMNRGQGVIFYQFAANDYGILKIVAGPRHEGGDQVFAKRQFAVGNTHAFAKYVTGLNFVAGADHDLLVNRGALIA